MKHRVRTASLILGAVFAISAIGASSAFAATTFHSAVHPQSVSGSQTSTHVFTTSAGPVTCKIATFSGTTSAKTSATQTLTPNYETCIPFGFGFGVPIHENGCAFIFNANGTSEIECPTGKKIEITAPFCTTSIGPQHIPSGVSYSNGAGDIVASTNISGIDYDECGVFRTNGAYTGKTTITGFSGNISVS